MFNPGMLGITPEQMEAAREVGKRIKVEIRKCPREGRLEIKYIPIDPGDTNAMETAANVVDSLAGQVATMHDMMFGMKGQIIHIG